MDFRQYDPTTARFSGIDLLAESSYNLTPYHFSNNNPIIFSDPSGLKPKAVKMSTIDNITPTYYAPTSGVLYQLNQGHYGSDLVEALRGQAGGSWQTSGGGSGSSTAPTNALTTEALLSMIISNGGGLWRNDGKGNFNHATSNASISNEGVFFPAFNWGSVGEGDKYAVFDGESMSKPLLDEVMINKKGVRSIGQPGELESLIPIWGSGRAAVDHFQNGNYWRGLGYTALAISDVFLVKSIATGIGRGAWKLGSHSWPATRKWMLKNGYVEKGEPLHHWAISQATAKKYGLESIANQPWNLMKFSTQAEHMRLAHGQMYNGIEGASALGQLYYGTPSWFIAGSISIGGRIVD